MKVKCRCLYCGNALPGFVECNCDKKFKNKEIWNIKKSGNAKGRPKKLLEIV